MREKQRQVIEKAIFCVIFLKNLQDDLLQHPFNVETVKSTQVALPFGKMTRYAALKTATFWDNKSNSKHSDCLSHLTRFPIESSLPFQIQVHGHINGSNG